jgi:hypothetical protein
VISGNYSLSNFKEDLQKMYKRAGMKGEGLMFLITDSQIIDERMLVYINDLLASGEIPDLFAPVRHTTAKSRGREQIVGADDLWVVHCL